MDLFFHITIYRVIIDGFQLQVELRELTRTITTKISVIQLEYIRLTFALTSIIQGVLGVHSPSEHLARTGWADQTCARDQNQLNIKYPLFPRLEARTTIREILN